MEGKLLTIEELCDWLQIGRTTVWQWRKQGMPHIKYGKSVRFDKVKVQAWLERKSQEKS